MKSRGGNCINPSVHSFMKNLGKILSMKFVNSSTTTNCESDQDILLINDLNNSIIDEVDESNGINSQELSHYVPAIEDDEENDVVIDVISDTDSELSEASIRYFIGYIAHKLYNRKNCKDCYKFMILSDGLITSPSERLIYYKKFFKQYFYYYFYLLLFLLLQLAL